MKNCVSLSMAACAPVIESSHISHKAFWAILTHFCCAGRCCQFNPMWVHRPKQRLECRRWSADVDRTAILNMNCTSSMFVLIQSREIGGCTNKKMRISTILRRLWKGCLIGVKKNHLSPSLNKKPLGAFSTLASIVIILSSAFKALKPSTICQQEKQPTLWHGVIIWRNNILVCFYWNIKMFVVVTRPHFIWTADDLHEWMISKEEHGLFETCWSNFC